ncbi:hypothetical protein FYZ45_08100 [Mobiluncus mulieris]|uniref:Secreted protein n=1 Tax=Mobiluncus mulieris TaxID=2052 RepID=A0ABD4TYZ7_9ACTO|nr:hypothetical protein [Mobiluncus mulieris]MCU9973891.1 hypothetical protein [Mobiluncus mulieris]MCV0009890.1 hypothetical protein [Mobiluncus mulieris]NMW75601.1 hypothetical protein [Mobiluncus mulieris]NMX01710.1 hypothetical protein [Mobiluncus mulieris]
MRCLPGCAASAVGGCAASARAWCATSAAYGCALAGQKGRFPLDFHFVKVSPLSPAARRTSLRRLRAYGALSSCGRGVLRFQCG